MSSSVLVTGATGTVGREVVKQLAATEATVRALVRSRQKAAAVEAIGAEVVVGDLDDRASLAAAMDGIDHLFLLSAADLRQVALQGNAIEVAQQAGVDHIVKLSAQGTAPDSPIALARWHAETEQQIRASGMGYTFLHPTSFMQNLLGMAPMIAQGNLYAAMKDGKISLVDARDIAAVAVAALTEPGHMDRTYVITGPEALSYADVAAALSEAIGRTVTYVDIPPEVARQSMLDMGMPAWLADDMTALYAAFSTGLSADVSPDFSRVTQREPIPFRQFAQEHADLFRGDSTH